ncbi:MAG: DEAD/DEAH box helicase [Candidatus Micrarchaeota archaeon]
MMPLDPRIERAIAKLGFVELTPVQQESIPIVMRGRNLLAQSKTGTGKTAAFAIPILQKLEENNKLQAVVVEPTRELAIQVGNDFRKIASEMPFRFVVAYGGTGVERQKELLEKGANVLVGTPDRLLDLIASQDAKLEGLKTVVLDEADLLFEYGLALKTRKILKLMPENAQKLFFCVHLPKTLEDEAIKYLNEFERVKTFAGSGKIVETLEHQVKLVEGKEKLQELVKLLKEGKKTLVFCKTKESVKELNLKLFKTGLKTRMLHGDFDAERRDKAINAFRKGKTKIMIATDVAARGIHVPGLELVVNYELPQNYDFYLHRIGRTARLGERGRVVTFVEKAEAKRWKEIQNKLGSAL